MGLWKMYLHSDLSESSGSRVGTSGQDQDLVVAVEDLDGTGHWNWGLVQVDGHAGTNETEEIAGVLDLVPCTVDVQVHKVNAVWVCNII